VRKEKNKEKAKIKQAGKHEIITCYFSNRCLNLQRFPL